MEITRLSRDLLTLWMRSDKSVVSKQQRLAVTKKKIDSRFFDSNQSLEKGQFLIHDSKQNQEKWLNCFESIDSLPISG